MELGALPGITVAEIVEYLGNSSHVGRQTQKSQSENGVCKLWSTKAVSVYRVMSAVLGLQKEIQINTA